MLGEMEDSGHSARLLKGVEYTVRLGAQMIGGSGDKAWKPGDVKFPGSMRHSREPRES